MENDDEWFEVCKREALLIDPETADVRMDAVDSRDPYCRDPREDICVGREYFARAPGRDFWVWFGDLPDEVNDRLWERLRRGDFDRNDTSVESSSSAERMRVLRLRRQRALRWVPIEVREAEVNALIRMGLLDPERRDDSVAIIEAVHAHLDVTLSHR